MNFKEKLRQVTLIANNSSHPIPLLLDLMRVKRSDYIGECKGFRFEIKAKRKEWFTLYENIVREDYLKHGIDLREGGIVIDIGANFGSFTALASQKVGNSGRVLSFEPDPIIFERLNRNIKMNQLANVTTFNAAVSDRDGEIGFFIHRQSAFSTIMDEVDTRSNDNTKCIRVPSRGINSVVADLSTDIDLLKIDCEGAEYAILGSLDKTSATRIKQISMEVHEVRDRKTDEISTMLRELGFVVSETVPLAAFMGSALV